jgi:hypothetical protein
MRGNPRLKLVKYLTATAKRLRRGRVGDPRIVANLIERAAEELRRAA